eukprot:1072750-Pyramimonas_sp.AAC.1
MHGRAEIVHVRLWLQEVVFFTLFVLDIRLVVAGPRQRADAHMPTRWPRLEGLRLFQRVRSWQLNCQ